MSISVSITVPLEKQAHCQSFVLRLRDSERKQVESSRKVPTRLPIEHERKRVEKAQAQEKNSSSSTDWWRNETLHVF